MRGCFLKKCKFGDKRAAREGGCANTWGGMGRIYLKSCSGIRDREDQSHNGGDANTTLL